MVCHNSVHHTYLNTDVHTRMLLKSELCWLKLSPHRGWSGARSILGQMAIWLAWAAENVRNYQLGRNSVLKIFGSLDRYSFKTRRSIIRFFWRLKNGNSIVIVSIIIFYGTTQIWETLMSTLRNKSELWRGQMQIKLQTKVKTFHYTQFWRLCTTNCIGLPDPWIALTASSWSEEARCTPFTFGKEI